MRFLLPLLLAALAACASPAVVQNPYVRTSVTPVTRLALAPGGGLLGESVAAALTARGFYVMPAEETAAVMRQAGVAVLDGWQVGILEPRLIHAVLEVQGDDPGTMPVSGRATVLRVPDGARIAEAQWRNRFGLAERALYSADAERIARELTDSITVRLRR